METVFVVEECKGKNMLFIGGGIGLAPLRSFIKYCFKHREDYGKITIIYGSRSYADPCFKNELLTCGQKKRILKYISL